MEEKKITIRQLTPDLCEDGLHYFDEIAFKDHGYRTEEPADVKYVKIMPKKLG